MSKLKLSPTATVVAAEILKLTQNMPQIVCSQDDLASLTSIKSNTVYKALLELTDIGAIEDTPRRDGIRTIIPIESHWIWFAVEQQGEQS